MSEESRRLAHVEAGMDRLQQEYTRVATDVASLATGQNSIIARLDSMAESSRTNSSTMASWAAVILSLVSVLVTAMAVYFSSAIESTAEHAASETQGVAGLSSIRHGFQEQEIAAAEERLNSRISHLDAQHHQTQDHIRDLIAEAGRAQVSRKAIGDYTRELGDRVRDLERLGWRNWPAESTP